MELIDAYMTRHYGSAMTYKFEGGSGTSTGITFTVQLHAGSTTNNNRWYSEQALKDAYRNFLFQNKDHL